MATANEEAHRSYTHALERLRSFCAFEEGDDGLIIERAKALSKAIAGLQALIKSLEERSSRLSRAELALGRSREKLASFYGEVGFEFGDLIGVKQLSAQWKRYAELVEELTIARRELDGFPPEVHALSLASDRAELTVRLEQATGKLNAVRQLHHDLGESEQYAASNCDELEKADDELQSARERWKRTVEAVRIASSGPL